jgi:hypothetical protein
MDCPARQEKTARIQLYPDPQEKMGNQSSGQQDRKGRVGIALYRIIQNWQRQS